MTREDLERFKDLDYEAFRRLATEEGLSPHERIGFPDSYREGKEQAILADLRAKARRLDARGALVVDVGPGCGLLALALVEHCRARSQTLVLVDSPEVLARLPDEPFARKVAGRFPSGCEPLVHELAGRADAVLVYSVLHYVFKEAPLHPFVDAALSLLAPGGALVLGDVPNVSMRKRFFASEAGILHHQRFTGTSEVPRVEWNRAEAGQLDDAVVLSIVARARLAGFDAWVVPQADDLPMANRREDILVRRP